MRRGRGERAVHLIAGHTRLGGIAVALEDLASHLSARAPRHGGADVAFDRAGVEQRSSSISKPPSEIHLPRPRRLRGEKVDHDSFDGGKKRCGPVARVDLPSALTHLS